MGYSSRREKREASSAGLQNQHPTGIVLERHAPPFHVHDNEANTHSDLARPLAVDNSVQWKTKDSLRGTREGTRDLNPSQ